MPNCSEFSLRQINSRCAGKSAAVHQPSQMLDWLMQLNDVPREPALHIIQKGEPAMITRKLIARSAAGRLSLVPNSNDGTGP